MGLGKQGKRKARRRSVDMAERPAAEAGYSPPPPEECEEYEYSMDPTGSDMAMKRDRVKVRMTQHAMTSRLTEFAIVQQTYDRGAWRDVAIADSAHDDEVHVHRYSRKTKNRVGEPEILRSVTSQADIDEGYELAYTVIVQQWERNKRRWRDG